jgi:hypothetical protein
MALSLDGTTGISASGNIYGNNIIVTGTLTAGSFSPSSFSAPGNVTGGNIYTAGVVSATGNITGNYILGNGSQLTGVDATQIINGTSNAKVVSSGGNIAVGIGGTANVAVFATTGVFVTGVASATGNVTGGNILTAGFVSATGNVTGGNILTAGFVSATGTVTGGNIATTGSVSATGNITGGNIATAGSVSATGNITGGNIVSGGGVGGNITGANVISGNTFNAITVSASGNILTAGNVSCGNIVNTNANGVGNIGSSTTYFNTVFAKATSAQYADLAEMYVADASYSPGTVLDFGGDKEVTATTTSHSTRVAGIVSTNPSYLMNSTLSCTNSVKVALVGRVPCQVVGTIAKGDRLVSSSTPGVATRLDITQYQPGCIVGKALEAYDSETVGTIEVAVGRL